MISKIFRFVSTITKNITTYNLFKPHHAASLSLIFLVSACTSYRIEIQQGNFVSQEMLEQLKLGMSKEQTKAILGSPLLTPSFQQSRWDYVFYLKSSNSNTPVVRKITLFFDENKLAKIDSDKLPSEPRVGEYLKPSDTNTSTTPNDQTATTPANKQPEVPAINAPTDIAPNTTPNAPVTEQPKSPEPPQTTETP